MDGAFFDLTIIGWLVCGCTRTWAFLVAGVFHLVTWLLFPQIGVFPWLMLGGALIFFPPDWPRRLFVWVRTAGKSAGRRAAPEPGKLASQETQGWLPSAAAIAIAFFLILQLAVPLRHYFYPGNVRWNEEGYRFSWRVLVTEKAGMVEYRVRDPESGRSWRVEPEAYVAPLQAERAATQPDMLLETAHIIADDFSARGYPRVQVYADAFVSMNGREHRRLLDPSVDQASTGHGLGPKRWVLAARNDPTQEHRAFGDLQD